MKILAIETSCDETAFAILEASGTIKSPIYKVIKNIVSSQIAIHREWGGVVPNLAKREHMKNLPLIFEKLKPYTKDIDVIAVTVGPGLEPALWTGIEFAKELHRTYFKKAKLIGVNHMEGHLFSNLLFSGKKKEIQFPAIGLIVSGGHTILIEMKSLVSWKKLGETLDDAVGEAFDKVARVLGLPYPGGPEIQAAAERGNEDAVQFPRPMLNQKNYNFSFSGLKTSVLYYMRDHKNANKDDVAASFERAAIDVLVKKTIRAAREKKAKSVLLSGGVAANKHLRKALMEACKKEKISFFAPSMKFNTDNASMIGVAGHMAILRKKKLPIRANGNLSI